ncbi:hypothetical protein CL629_02280 [bacterium]|nr:hypothetical protein [bacterium]|tara:strand:- start:1367 stop:1627 length:261 start_codon:yes stop_codon:yes gene_type:complete
MKPSKKMSVREMDRVNDLLLVTRKIERLNLTRRERGLIYFRFKEGEIPLDLEEYALRFDELLSGAQELGVLSRLRDLAIALRCEEG